MYETGTDFVEALNNTAQSQIDAHVSTLPEALYGKEMIGHLDGYGKEILIVPNMPDYSPEGRLRAKRKEKEKAQAELDELLQGREM